MLCAGFCGEVDVSELAIVRFRFAESKELEPPPPPPDPAVEVVVPFACCPGLTIEVPLSAFFLAGVITASLTSEGGVNELRRPSWLIHARCDPGAGMGALLLVKR